MFRLELEIDHPKGVVDVWLCQTARHGGDHRILLMRVKLAGLGYPPHSILVSCQGAQLSDMDQRRVRTLLKQVEVRLPPAKFEALRECVELQN